MVREARDEYHEVKVIFFGSVNILFFSPGFRRFLIYQLNSLPGFSRVDRHYEREFHSGRQDITLQPPRGQKNKILRILEDL
jgi:hypothetical protein